MRFKKCSIPIDIVTNKAITVTHVVCAWCRSIRDSEGLWVRPVSMPPTGSEAVLSHGICPTCQQAFFVAPKQTEGGSPASIPPSRVKIAGAS